MIPALDELEVYAEAVSTPEPEFLRRLREEADRTTACPQMIAGPLQGRLLAMVTQLCGARRVLEIGTFVGYSALWFAGALPEGGEVVTVDRDPGIRPIAERYFAQAPSGQKITLRIGDALEVIRDLRGPFDLVFIDADKVNYLRYYETVFDKVPSGGVFLADNVLWSGRVLDPAARDPETEALRTFAQRVCQDRRVEVVLLTVRDGLLLARKR